MDITFTTDLVEIQHLIEQIDPIAYAQSRNYVNGKVTYLSPYLSRGVISTRQIVESLKVRNFQFHEVETLVKELAWREYYQRVWMHLKEKMMDDILRPQEDVQLDGIPKQLIEGNSGITAIDEGIKQLYDKGYLHNHVRMYLSSIICNVGKYRWNKAAEWMYYHLLDGDLASNSLSWQWVAGCFSSKKYYANQENINMFTNSQEEGTYLDVSYEALPNIPVPACLKTSINPTFDCHLPETNQSIHFSKGEQVYIYTYYNLDSSWNQSDENTNILLLEPSFFSQFPISPKCIDFMLMLAQHITNLQVFVGEFAELKKLCGKKSINYKEHPSNLHFSGTEHAREWLFPEVTEYYTSFSKFWKVCRPLAQSYFSAK